jgi:sulfonate transport system ATP-binding protein
MSSSRPAPSALDDQALTRLLFPHPPARPAGTVARTVGLHRVHAHGRLHGVDFHVSAGELVVVLGGPHTGKSTLIQSLAGIDRQGDGLIDVANSRSALLQHASLIAWKRVLANVSFGNRSAERRDAARRALERVDAADLAAAWPSELDQGDTVRVLLARAIADEPALVLLDEPLAGLDAEATARTAAVIRRFVEQLGVAVVLTTDSVSDALALADRIVVLNDGEITLELTVDAATRSRDGGPARDRLRIALSSAVAGVSSLGA